ncbi:hypothetical protein LCGC14_1135500 [marine sediment metagenome]|uniref:2TM domain-containing protein n=1 Tax=marine sediment metagenome TaxID=412755 RepID=A0A0F9M4Q3_9ZZZZ
MSDVSGFSDESLRSIAAQKVNYRFFVKIHITVFLLVNILLFIINLLSTPKFPWIVFPFFSWLIGVTLHILTYLLYARGIYPIAKRSVIYNVNSFIFVMLLLFITNYITSPGIYWVLFPTIFWGGLVILHIIIYIRYFSTKIENNGKVKSRKERAIEKELEKMRKRQINRNNR